jgi:hypothetical protein
MSQDQPHTYDAVLGGQHPNSLATAAILGGLEGVKQRLASDQLNLPTKALKDALDYGAKGEALIREYFNHPDHSQFFIDLVKAGYTPQISEQRACWYTVDATTQRELQQIIRLTVVDLAWDNDGKKGFVVYPAAYSPSNLPTSTQTSVAKLTGTWNYQVSFVSSLYQIQISNQDGQLIGRYVVPDNNDSVFEIRVYESGRGKPVVTIVQIAQRLPNYSYRATLNGRLDSDTLVTGNFVDVDNNRGSFTMTKK